MAQQYGLGRGLASLIPPKKATDGTPAPGPVNTSSPTTPASSPFVIHPVDDRSASGSEIQAQKSAEKPAALPKSDPAVSSVANPVLPKTSSVPVSEVKVPSSKTITPSVKMTSSDGGKVSQVMKVAIGDIVPNPEQPRLQFDQAKLQELSDSIREHGILQPLVVSRKGDGKYELIAGERRLQASKLAGLSEVPVLVRDASEQEKLELAIIENIQRHNLNPIEEAKAFLRLMEEFGLHQEEVAKKMGKSRSVVANTVRLLHLPVEIQRALIEGTITEGHAKALLSIENPEKQRALFEMIVKSGLTVRETEVEARSVSPKPSVRQGAVIDPNMAARMEKLREHLGTKVKIAPTAKGGRIVIEYYSPEELEGLFSRFGI